LRQNATEIRQAADRAATLTRQLLASGRKQILQPETLDLNLVLTSLNGLIRHQGALDPGVGFFLKPFTPAALAEKVRTPRREILDSPKIRWGEHPMARHRFPCLLLVMRIGIQIQWCETVVQPIAIHSRPMVSIINILGLLAQPIGLPAGVARRALSAPAPVKSKLGSGPSKWDF
jgi:hypothetical protein